MAHPPLATDGSQLRAILDLLGAPQEPTQATRDRVAQLERWVGPLAPETRSFLLTPVDLWNPSAEHPEVDAEFEAGLPNVEAFITSLTLTSQGLLNATMHFLGLYPVGAQISYNDWMVALVVLEPYAAQLGGVMYYDEREVGTWGRSVSEFLIRAIAEYWKEADGALEGVEPGEEPDLSDLRDCFLLSSYDYREKPPSPAEPDPELTKAWETHWRARTAGTSRWWVNSFISNRLDRNDLRNLPTEAEWGESRSRVGSVYHEAVYWLVSHMLLDNKAELAECLELTSDHPGELVQAVRSRFLAEPTFGERFAAPRAALFTLVREGAADY